MITNQELNSLITNINTIYELLYLPDLDDTMFKMLSFYVKAYNQTLEERQYNHSEEIEHRYKTLSGPIYIVDRFPDNDDNQIPYPAIEFIKKNIHRIDNTHATNTQDKSMVRSLRPAIPNTFPEEPQNYQINGFSYAIIIVFFTILLGIGLGTLLFFIK